MLADVLLPVQKAALGVFQKFTSLPREELWHELMDVLTGLLRPEQLEQVQALNNSKLSIVPWNAMYCCHQVALANNTM